jgi:hypothetical protein
MMPSCFLETRGEEKDQDNAFILVSSEPLMGPRESGLVREMKYSQ